MASTDDLGAAPDPVATMSFQVAWNCYPTDGPAVADGMVVSTPEDVGILVGRLADVAADTATVHLSESGVFADPPMIDHTVHAVVIGDYGCLSHWDTTHDLAFSRGDSASTGHESEVEDFPHGSGLSLPRFTDALVELLTTGHRPVSIGCWSGTEPAGDR
jgi:hypothetical protein